MTKEPERILYGKAGQRFLQPRKVLALTLVTGVLAWLLTSCAGTTSFGGSDNGKTIMVHVGDEVDVALDSNPTTGYQWAIDKSDDTLLTLKESSYASSSNLVGSGGTQTLKFVAKSAGKVNLQLKYWRSFEGDKSVSQRYAVTIQIQP